MLSFDVSNVLSLLSAISQTPHVFVFRACDACASFPVQPKNLDTRIGLMAQLSNLSFTDFYEHIQQSSKTLSNPSNNPVYKAHLVSVDAFHELYLCSVYTHECGDVSVDAPDVILGVCIDIEGSWNQSANSALGSLANMLQFQMKQEAKLRAVARSEALFKEISSLNKDYIYVKDAQGKIIFANKAVIQLFPDDTYRDIVEHKLQAIFEKNIEQPIAEVNALAKLKGEHQREDSITLQNSTVMVLQTMTQRFHAHDGTLYLLVVSRDVTEREVIIKDLKRSNQDLDSFAYVASHDLKAPLNVIKRLVSWVMEDCADVLPQDSLDDLALVMSRARRMEQLLQDLLAYSRIGKEYQQAKEVNVKQKVVELLSLIDLPMGFVVNCDDSEVKVPEVPFGVVLLNLIANAIKHHDSGNAKIQIKVRRNQTSNVITVMDNGPGIALENRARIFDLFETLKPRDEIEGSGMGLSVVKRLVEHYGGHIKVEDHRPRGTKFIVYWPFNNMAEQVLTQLS
ncbi:ATP-binding protein [Glaciecola sp. SC05]|uniref:sensor histidine kinase n=1 Tax=Glaciecola sp. SC05 TaxID=1987355 RepID=UPI00352893F0